MYRFIIERSDKIVHLRGQKYSLAKITNFINTYLSDTYKNKHDKEHLFHK